MNISQRDVTDSREDGVRSVESIPQTTLLDIVDVNRLRRVTKQFSRMTHTAVGLVDHPTQAILLHTGWMDICAKFHRTCPKSNQQCLHSNLQLTTGLNSRQRVNIEHCSLGLVDGATPVIVGGLHLADLYIGQVLFAEPDREYFRQQAREYGFDETEYLAALDKVRVVDKDQFRDMLKYLSELAELIGEMGQSYVRLKDNESQYRQLMDATQEPIVVIRDQRYVYVNPALCRMLGYSDPSDLMGINRQEVVAEEYRELVTSNHIRRLAGEPVASCFEMRMLHRDGRSVWVEVSAELIEFGGLRAVQASLHDITARRNAEYERQELIEELNATNEELNATNEELNLTNEELIATNEELSDTVQELNTANEELNRIYEELNSTYEELHGTYEDLARTEEEVRASEERFRALIENAADGIVILDSDLKLIYESQPDGTMLGYVGGELIGVSVLAKVHPDDTERVTSRLAGLMAEPGLVFRIRFRFQHNNGDWRMLDATLQNLLNHEHVRGVVVNYRDITARWQTEKALEQSELRYRTTIDSMSDAIHVVNRDLQIILHSATLARWHSEYGYQGQINGRHVRDVFSFLTDDVIVQYQRVFAGAGPVITEEVNEINGRTVITETRKVPVFEGGKVVRVLTVIRDISERRKAELALRDSEEAYRELVENMNESLVVVDSGERMTFANPAAEQLFGVPVGELIGCNWSDFTDPETFSRITRETQQRHTGRSGEYEIVLRRRDGELRNVLVVASPLQNGAGEITGSFGLLRDVTRQRQAAVALQRSEEQFRALVENSPDIIIRYDRDLRVVYANPAVRTITGESPEDMIGRTCDELGYPGHHCTAGTQKISEVFSTGQPCQFEVRMDGSTIFDWRLNPEFDGEGGVASVLGIITDVTERKRLTDRLIREQKDESMLTLAGGIAHDFNNILIGVLGSATMLHDSFSENAAGVYTDGFEDESLELCATVITASQRMADLTNKLLAYARGGNFQPQPVDLAETIHDSLAMVRGRIPSNIEVELELADDLWPVEADPGQLHQVWLNLIINAEEAMPGGGTLRIQAENRVYKQSWTCPLGHPHEAGRYLYIVVEDTGDGMDQATLERIFEPFFSTKFQGRGLGLAAVIGIVSTHDGCISATSVVGQGSRFVVNLPCTDKLVVKEATQQLAAALPGETVLVVDDEEIVRVTARRMLQRRGFTVLTANNATDGLIIYRERRHDIDLVMFDMHMPRVSGAEFYQSLRQLDQQVKTIAISGYNESVALKSMDASKLDAFIQKPFAFKALVSRIREVLDSR